MCPLAHSTLFVSLFPGPLFFLPPRQSSSLRLCFNEDFSVCLSVFACLKEEAQQVEEDFALGDFQNLKTLDFAAHMAEVRRVICLLSCASSSCYFPCYLLSAFSRFTEMGRSRCLQKFKLLVLAVYCFC